jgi:hypothetical protein
MMDLDVRDVIGNIPALAGCLTVEDVAVRLQDMVEAQVRARTTRLLVVDDAADPDRIDRENAALRSRVARSIERLVAEAGERDRLRRELDQGRRELDQARRERDQLIRTRDLLRERDALRQRCDALRAVLADPARLEEIARGVVERILANRNES